MKCTNFLKLTKFTEEETGNLKSSYQRNWICSFKTSHKEITRLRWLHCWSLLLLLLLQLHRVSDSVQPHRRQPTRLHHPWDSPGKKTGVGCHLLLHCMKVKSESELAQSCPTLCDPMDCSPPGSSIHGIFQARVLEWGAIAFSTVEVYHLPKSKTNSAQSLSEN